MPYKPRRFNVVVKRGDKWYRAHCGGCKYVSNQHADLKQAERVAKNHADMKHFNDIVSVVRA